MVRHAHHPEHVEGQIANNKQITMTEIQNHKLKKMESETPQFWSLIFRI